MGQAQLRRVVFALNCYLAVVLALFVAFALDLPNPWWAMVSVFLSQPTPPIEPLTGAIWAKALYRVAGTVIACVASILLIPNLSDAPELLILALALWVGGCLYISLLDRTPRSYIFMLAGYTLALVGIPFVNHPTGIFDTAVARTEEILIGVLSTAVVQSIFLPRSVIGSLFIRVNQILDEARGWISHGLTTFAVMQPPAIPRKVAFDLTQINLLATNLKFEGEFSRRQARLLRALEQRLIALLPLTSAIEDRLRTLAALDAVPPEIPPLVDRVAAWIGAPDKPDGKTGRELKERLMTLTPDLSASSDWKEMLVTSICERLLELMVAWEECVAVGASLCDPSPKTPSRMLENTPPRVLHVDHGIALWSASVVALTIIAVSTFTIAIHWEAGALAIGITAVLCSLFAAADDPTPMVGLLILGFIIALPIDMAYEFAVLPAIDGFVMLSAVLFPLVFGIGYFFTQPKYALLSLAIGIGLSAGLSLQPEFISDFPSFMNAYTALLTGAGFAFAGLAIARVVPVQLAIRRILRAGWRDLAALTQSATIPDRRVWVSRMLDRVGLLLPRLAVAAPDKNWELMDALRDLRLGVSIIDLRNVYKDVHGDGRAQLDSILAVLGAHYQALSRGAEPALPSEFPRELDRMAGSVLRKSNWKQRHQGVLAMTSLRRSLCPTGSGYRPVPEAE